MEVVNRGKNQDTGRLEVDILGLNDIDIMYLHEAVHNFISDPDTKRAESRKEFKEILKQAIKFVRPT